MEVTRVTPGCQQARVTECRAKGRAVNEVADGGGGGYRGVVERITDETEFCSQSAIDEVPGGGVVQGAGGFGLIEGSEETCLEGRERGRLLDLF